MADQKRTAALTVLSGGGTQADAARAAEVDKSTVGRWLKQEAFTQELAELVDQRAQDPVALSSLVPFAYDLLRKALTGEEKATAAQQTVALNILTKAETIDKAGAASGVSLAQRLEELDARDERESD